MWISGASRLAINSRNMLMRHPESLWSSPSLVSATLKGNNHNHNKAQTPSQSVLWMVFESCQNISVLIRKFRACYIMGFVKICHVMYWFIPRATDSFWWWPSFPELEAQSRPQNDWQWLCLHLWFSASFPKKYYQRYHVCSLYMAPSISIDIIRGAVLIQFPYFWYKASSRVGEFAAVGGMLQQIWHHKGHIGLLYHWQCAACNACDNLRCCMMYSEHTTLMHFFGKTRRKPQM